MRRKKIQIGKIVSIALCILLIPIILLNIIMIAKTYTEPEHLPSAFGISPVVVLSGSMSPEFEAEDLIFVKKTDTDMLKKGDIICFMQSGVTITHRIEEVVTEDGEIRYITKGDANNIVDNERVLPSQVEGKYIGHWDGVGGLVMFMQSTPGMIVFVALPILCYLLFDFWYGWRSGRNGERRIEELEEELAALRAEKHKKL